MELTAKQRVENELEELNEKITKLSSFLYGTKILSMNLSYDMRYQMEEQLRAMQQYARCLQARLLIWGKTDAEIEQERQVAKISCCD